MLLGRVQAPAELRGEVMRLAAFACEESACSRRCAACAGTGKSLLLKHILRALPQATTYVTASTGLAASVLGGTTLNAFAGLSSSD